MYYVIRSARFERNTKIVPQNGSCRSTDCTVAARPSAPRRKSTGRVAISTRTPEGGAPKRAGITSSPSTGAVPCREKPTRPRLRHARSRSRSLPRQNRCCFPPPPEQSRVLACRPRPLHWQPPIRTPAARRRVGCDADRSATRSRSPAHPAPGSPRRSPPSPHRSSVAGAVSPSGLPRGENCAHQLANYLAHHPPASIKEAGSPHSHLPAQGGGQSPLTLVFLCKRDRRVGM